MQLERITIRSMNLISLSLDMVPGLKDGSKFLILRLVTICVLEYLSKKLNPGDAIYMIYYVVHTPNLQNASVTGCSSVVNASKAN